MIGMAVAVLLPLSFYLIAKVLKKDRIAMPRYYIADRVDSSMVDGQMQRDTVFHKVADLVLTNQVGEQVSLNKDLSGKILVVDFIYTTCPSICPKLTQNMMLLQKAFRKDPKKKVTMNDEVHLLSITVDPERDSFQILRKYADRFRVNHDHWYFLTGDKEAIYNYARKELGLSVQPEEHGAVDFIHTQKIVVIDQNRYIRGYYDGMDNAALAKCAYDISLLSMEKKKKK